MTPPFVVALATSGLGVAINLATEWKTNLWAWAAVVVITLLSAGVTLWLTRRQLDQEAWKSRGLVVESAHIGRDNIQIGRVEGNVTIERDV